MFLEFLSPYNYNNNNNNNYIVPIKGPRRGRELPLKQILIQCTYNNTTFFFIYYRKSYDKTHKFALFVWCHLRCIELRFAPKKTYWCCRNCLK